MIKFSQKAKLILSLLIISVIEVYFFTKYPEKIEFFIVGGLLLIVFALVLGAWCVKNNHNKYILNLSAAVILILSAFIFYFMARFFHNDKFNSDPIRVYRLISILILLGAYMIYRGQKFKKHL